MTYTELTFVVDPPVPGSGILIAWLSELGFESFEETPDGLKAYIQTERFSDQTQQAIETIDQRDFHFTYHIVNLENKNWNAVWESNYEPVMIGNRVYIYAPFHPKKTNVEYSILIEPKMSFGTAHHETTSLMIEMMLDDNLKGNRVLDMGCGTAVLAVLAEKMGAAKIMAIDNDENAFENSMENAARNNCAKINVAFGGAEKISGMFDKILANINKNILLRDMTVYSEHLLKDGSIFFSGFYQSDLDDIQIMAKQSALILESFKEKNNWVCARFIKRG